VFRLSDGTQVSIKKGDKVKKGQYWQLEVLDAE